MSGLCGAVNFSQALVEKPTLAAMATAASHRGPDGTSYSLKESIGFVHLALHITPESVTETLPLKSSDDQLLLTADARLDNRQDLINQVASYCKSSIPSDAELILAAYQRWGVDCCQHFLGDFAFAIWDQRRQHLFAARDPMAMRPFFYRIEPERVLFASEIKQILALPDVPAEIYEPAIAAYLSGLHEPLKWTFYQGIFQLEPGHAIVIRPDGHRLWSYWEADLSHKIRYKREEEYVEHFLAIFEDAVRCRIRSTKPIGLFLSGGMDSTSIASMAGHLLEKEPGLCPQFRTYSFAFEELPQCDERFISNHIVERFQFPATSVLADDAWPLKDYPAHAPSMDSPNIGVYQPLLEKILAVAQADGVGLMMSGDRGDLTMGEYIYDFPNLWLSGHWLTLIQELHQQSQWRGQPLAEMFRRYLWLPIDKSFKDWLRTWPALDRLSQQRQARRPFPDYPDWVAKSFRQRVTSSFNRQTIKPRKIKRTLPSYAQRQRYQSIFTPMHMQGMVWSNLTQAQFGIGFADPWSDRRIASFALAVPQRILNTTGQEKRLVRQAMTNIMPEDALQQVQKIYPYDLYLQAIQTKSRQTILSLLENSEAANRGYINADDLSKAYQTFLDSQREISGFWETLTLEMWLQQHWSKANKHERFSLKV